MPAITGFPSLQERLKMLNKEGTFSLKQCSGTQIQQKEGAISSSTSSTKFSNCTVEEITIMLDTAESEIKKLTNQNNQENHTRRDSSPRRRDVVCNREEQIKELSLLRTSLLRELQNKVEQGIVKKEVLQAYTISGESPISQNSFSLVHATRRGPSLTVEEVLMQIEKTALHNFYFVTKTAFETIEKILNPVMAHRESLSLNNLVEVSERFIQSTKNTNTLQESVRLRLTAYSIVEGVQTMEKEIALQCTTTEKEKEELESLKEMLSIVKIELERVLDIV